MMNNFYDNITQNEAELNKAKTLRKSQLALIDSFEFSHPYYWAPFVMVGNWL